MSKSATSKEIVSALFTIFKFIWRRSSKRREGWHQSDRELGK
jgi:hypothetical protein